MYTTYIVFILSQVWLQIRILFAQNEASGYDLHMDDVVAVYFQEIYLDIDIIKS